MCECHIYFSFFQLSNLVHMVETVCWVNLFDVLCSLNLFWYEWHCFSSLSSLLSIEVIVIALQQILVLASIEYIHSVLSKAKQIIVFEVDGWFRIGSLLCAKSPCKNVEYHLAARMLVPVRCYYISISYCFIFLFCSVVDYSSDWA